MTSYLYGLLLGPFYVDAVSLTFDRLAWISFLWLYATSPSSIMLASITIDDRQLSSWFMFVFGKAVLSVIGSYAPPRRAPAPTDHHPASLTKLQ